MKQISFGRFLFINEPVFQSMLHDASASTNILFTRRYGAAHPHITDVSWRLDHIVKVS